MSSKVLITNFFYYANKTSGFIEKNAWNIQLLFFGVSNRNHNLLRKYAFEAVFLSVEWNFYGSQGTFFVAFKHQKQLCPLNRKFYSVNSTQVISTGGDALAEFPNQNRKNNMISQMDQVFHPIRAKCWLCYIDFEICMRCCLAVQSTQYSVTRLFFIQMN